MTTTIGQLTLGLDQFLIEQEKDKYILRTNENQCWKKIATFNSMRGVFEWFLKREGNTWTPGIPTEDGDYIVCMSDSISTPMHVPCTVRNGKPFISMMYDTKQRTIRAYMSFKPYMR